ncbi:MAG TPA: lysophospholipid acyltransferase family protein [Bryobacteraceae bacterium]|nr:lysophospholipid acyltransferase family protein [Bryobacteraceae bacterium]
MRAYLITDPLIALATIIYATISVVLSFFDSSGRRPASIAAAWARLLLLISRVKVRVKNGERIQADGSYVIASNHASYMDTPVVLANLPVQFRFLAKKGLFSIPFLGTHLARAGHIPVYRGDPRAAVKTLSRAAEAVQEKRISLLVFPEGGRTHDGVMQDFKEGAAYMAIKAGVPLVPIALKGTRAVLPFGSGHVRGGLVELRVGEPIPTVGLKLHDRVRITEEARAQIVAMLQDSVEAQ